MTSKKNEPTFFPMGYGIRSLDNGIVVLDFIDNYEKDINTIISSVALPKEQAKELAEKILKLIGE